MRLAYVYKLRLNTEQSVRFDTWLDMLSYYNYNKYEACPLTTSVIGANGHPWKVSGDLKIKKQEKLGIFALIVPVGCQWIG
jgi:hypothetical protein